jgi:tricarballylate dehydrogenase
VPDSTVIRDRYDVVVAGGGNAALCAALEARRLGASVIIIEAAPIHLRGGNSRHTRNVRYKHTGPDNFLIGDYEEDEFFKDLLQVTGGETDEHLARLCINSSQDLGDWIKNNGVRWQPALSGTLQLNRTNAFFLGGGKALVNAYYRAALDLGVEAVYDSPVQDITSGDEELAVLFEHEGQPRRVKAGSVVVASGGFEANIEWLSQWWGEAANNFLIRGTPFNRGGPMTAIMNRGAKAIGNPQEYHAVACDARGPQFDGGIVTRVDVVPLGISVNIHAQRFSDEGVDFWPKRYASWGGLITRLPQQIMYSIVDSKAINDFMPSLYPPIQAQTIPELARQLNLDAETLVGTINEYNAHVVPGTFDLNKLDDCRTEGLEVPKSHWARRIDVPPYFAYPLRAGITFTYHGLGVTHHAEVLRDDDQVMPGVFAAGEAMAGNILGRGYMAGFGMTIGSVFGRIAGREAAKHALK